MVCTTGYILRETNPKFAQVQNMEAKPRCFKTLGELYSKTHLSKEQKPQVLWHEVFV